jgi:FKBP-type peptidyl-prolyl cis-trans isomerase
MMSRPTVLAALFVLVAATGCKQSAPAPEQSQAPAAPAATTEPTPAAKDTAPAAAASATPENSQAMSEPGQLPAPSDVASPPADAQKTSSGLATKVLTAGTGKEHPTDDARVKVHYTGWSKDGKMFDSSVVRGEPASFGVTGVIRGWTEALKLMVVGEKRRLWIPADLAYGEVAKRPGAPTGQLTFDVELLDIMAAPKAPEDVAAPPKDAKKTTTGLAYKVLTTGKGKTHPTASSRVTVHYTGWSKDGKMFDSSVVRDTPATFSLGQVIPGWTEGVQLMVEGEKTRFWIPGKLAYGDTPKRPGAPAGQLTFDIELLQIR